MTPILTNVAAGVLVALALSTARWVRRACVAIIRGVEQLRDAAQLADTTRHVLEDTTAIRRHLDIPRQKESIR